MKNQKPTGKDKGKGKPQKIKIALEDLETEGKDVKGGRSGRPPDTIMCAW
jgi:hypothetical protein